MERMGKRVRVERGRNIEKEEEGERSKRGKEEGVRMVRKGNRGRGWKKRESVRRERGKRRERR